MEFIDIPTEQTTAATDLLLAVVAIVAIFFLRRRVNRSPDGSWISLLGWIAFSAFFGAIVHGLQHDAVVYRLLWYPVYMGLGTGISFLGANSLQAIREGWRVDARIVWTFGAAMGIISRIEGAGEIVFRLFAAGVLFGSLAIYSNLCLQRRERRHLAILTGIMITIVACLFQTTTFTFDTPLGIYDKNGIFHLLLIPGMVFIAYGAAHSDPASTRLKTLPSRSWLGILRKRNPYSE